MNKLNKEIAALEFLKLNYADILETDAAESETEIYEMLDLTLDQIETDSDLVKGIDEQIKNLQARKATN